MKTNARARGRLQAASLTIAALSVASCSSSSYSSSSASAPAPNMSTRAPTPDPRVGLKPGKMDTVGGGRRHMLAKADEAIWNLKFISNTQPSEGFRGVTNSDLAFVGKYVVQGNYNGYQVWDVSNPRSPKLASAVLCPASQSDVSVYKNLLFVSAEAPSARLDCGTEPLRDSVSHNRIRGVRIFDATDITKPRYIHNVQSCRGSHTHTVVSDPKDPNNIYIYVSGNQGVRSESELKGCSDLAASANPTSDVFRIEVIKVPLGDPTQASLVSAPRIFQDLAPAPTNAGRSAADSIDRLANAAGRRGGGRGGRGGGADSAAGNRGGGGGGRANRPRQGPSQCHDITVYPAIGMAGGACGGYGLLLDIRDVANPVRVGAVADSNFSFWHSATFSNDGSKVLFTDEWGGGGAPRCRASDRYEWGANALFTIENNRMVFKSYYKMPAAQTNQENCVAHNGSLIPIPGRDVMVQGWYQGGISVFDWTDPARPVEIAYHDRGPLDADRMLSAGSWSVYWYNGYVINSEIARGLDIFELQPSGFISQNEIDAANTVKFDFMNAQEQPKMVWPPSFPLARAFVDQLERSNGLSATRISAVRTELTAAEKASGQNRRNTLTALATGLSSDPGSTDQRKVRMLADAVRDLANATR